MAISELLNAGALGCGRHSLQGLRSFEVKNTAHW